MRVGAALAALVVAAAGATLAEAAPPAGALPCAAAQLRAQVGETHGAAGTISFSVLLRNVSGRRCLLAGYPALQLRNAGGNLRTRVRHGGLAFLAKPARSFVVAPGGRATLLLAYNHVPHEGETTCPTATSLLLRTPGAVAGMRVAVRLDPCNRGLIYESPLLPGVVRPA